MDDLLSKFDMTGIIDVIDFLKPTSIYDGLTSMAMVYIGFAIPAFFTLSFFARYLEESAKSMAGEAKFVVAIWDTFKAALFIAVYAVVGLMLVELISLIGEKFYEYGSFAVVADSYATTIEQVEAIVKDQDKNTSNFSLWNVFSKGLMVSVPGNPIAATRSLTTAAGWLFFYCTVILFVFIYAFLRLAYCILYCFIYLWGFAVLPMMISKKMDLSNGWVKTMLCLLIWPIAESTFYGFATLMFESFSQDLVGTYSNKIGVTVLMGNVYILFGITNLVLSALSVSAVFVAFFLAMNQSAALGVAAPFIAAATAGAGMFQNAALQVQRTAGRNLAGLAVKGAGSVGQSAGSLLSKGAGAIGNVAGSLAGAAQTLTNSTPSGDGGPSSGPSTPSPASVAAPGVGSASQGPGPGATSNDSVKGQQKTPTKAADSDQRVGDAGSSPRGPGDSAIGQTAKPAANSDPGHSKSILSDIPKIGGASQVGGVDGDPEGKE